MKHVKKKFILSKKVEGEASEYLKNVKPNSKTIEKFKAGDFKDYIPYLLTDRNDFIQCFKYKTEGKVYLIPEPNPIVIYFSNAQNNLVFIKENRENLLKILSNKVTDIADIMNPFYDLFGFVSNYVTSLFNSLEAFLNQQIPNDYKYEKIKKEKTEIYNKEQIQREISFEDKLKRVIPNIKNKSFHRHYGHKFEIILKFKEFRDDIVHTKVDQKSTPNHYQDLFSKSLDFDYLKTIKIIRDYLNYYEPNLIEKCDCGQDF